MRHDVCIVGAGPAGTHLALRLAALGRRVALLDARTFPRHKPCGEFLSPECRPLLAEVGLGDLPERCGAAPVDGMRLAGHGRVVDGRYLADAPGAAGPGGFAIRREVLDTASFRHAAEQRRIAIHEGCRVRRLLREPAGRVTGVEMLDPRQRRRALSADFVVGADGIQSRVATELGARRPIRWLDRFAIVARYAAIDDRRHAEVHFFDRAWIAVAPVDGAQLTLNLVFDRADLPAGRRGLEPFLRRHLAAVPALAPLAAAAPIDALRVCGPLAGRTTRQTFDGAALVGDACGYVDPVTGEGLYFAMRGAALLADGLDRALHARRSDAASLRGYARRRKREFGPRFAMARALQRGLRHPAIVRTFLGALAARPGLAELLVTVTGDTVSPRALLDPRRIVRAWR